MTSVVGVDIGGTKTHLALAEVGAAGESDLREIVVPSSSWRGELGDFHADGVALRRLLVDHFGDDVLCAPLAVGAHGCDNTNQCRELERQLRSHFSGPVIVVNDSELMAPAMGVDRAIGVVVGTGSIATSRSETGELVVAGGWGWLLGDEGSAPALVREAARAVLAHLDRGGEIDALAVRLMASFDARDGADLALAVSSAASTDAWGSRAPDVFAAADEGSELADAVIRDAGETLAGLVETLRERGIRADAVVAGGAVIERQPRLQDAFRAGLARRMPEIELNILAQAPVMGAIALAHELAYPPHTKTLGSENSHA